MTLELHPLCGLFPRLGDDELHALAADIAAHGLREPITLHSGMVLDGGNRYRACLIAGVEPRFVEFAGDSIVAFVLSANLHRRHLTPGQQAAIVASAQDWAKAQPAHRPEKAGNVAPLSTLADRTAQSGASERTQRMADKVAKADPAMAKKVAHGEVTLPAAVKAVDTKQQGQQPKRKPATLPGLAPAAEPAGDDDTEADLLADLQTEVESLTALVKVAEADDLKAEVIKWRRMYDDAVRKQADAMDAVKRAEKREAFLARQLQKCGRAVGETNPDKVAAAVEAMARIASRVAA